MLWPAAAAFITAAVSWSGLTNWIVDFGVFAFLVITLTALGRSLARTWRHKGGASGLNERGAQLIGGRGLVANFANGVGAVRVNDTVWRAVSDDALEAGASVEITAIDGVTLKVKRIGAAPPP